MSQVLDEVLEKLNQLPIEEQIKVREKVEENQRLLEQRKRADFIRSLKGKYKDSLSSVDDFLARKHADIELEDNGWQPK